MTKYTVNNNIKLEYIHQPYWGNNFCVLKDENIIIYVFRQNQNRELCIYDRRRNLEKVIYESTNDISNIVVNNQGTKIAFYCEKLIVYDLVHMEIVFGDSSYYTAVPAQFIDDKNEVLVVHRNQNHNIIEIFDFIKREREVIYESKFKIGDPDGEICFRGKTLKHSLVYSKGIIIALEINEDINTGQIRQFKKRDGEYFEIWQKEVRNIHVTFPLLEMDDVNVYWSEVDKELCCIKCKEIIYGHERILFSTTCDIRGLLLVSPYIFIETIPHGGCSSFIKLINYRDKFQCRELILDKGCNSPLEFFDGKLYYMYSSSREPAECWVYDLDTNQKRKLTHTAPYEIRRVLNPVDELVCKIDGYTVYAKIYYPREMLDNERCDLLLWLHGGPNIFNLNEYNGFENWLCNNGFIVCIPSYRGTLGYGWRYANDITGKGLGIVEVQDIQICLTYVKKILLHKISNIFIAGVSYGGYLVLQMLQHSHEKIHGAVAYAAITDWKKQYQYTTAKALDNWLLGINKEKTISNKKKSPIYLIDKIKTPLLLTHGMKDNDVPFIQVEEYVSKCEECGNSNISYHFYENEGHSLPRFSDNHYFEWHIELIDFLKNKVSEKKVWNEYEDCVDTLVSK